MDKEHKDRKKTTDELIEEAAEKGARKLLTLQYRAMDSNHYRAMEDLLRAYPRRIRLMEHPEEFDFFPTGHSKDISIAPPPGTGVIDKIEAAEMFTEARKRAFEYEMFRLYETEYAIAPFKHLSEFAVVRLLYFNQDAHGNDRGVDAKHLTWEEIAEELETIGLQRAITVIRRWRSRLVREMTVMLFGAEGALSINSRESAKNNKKGKGEKNAAEVDDSEGQVHSED